MAHPKCGANTPHGPCRNPAGHGTKHVGYGQCRKHAGNTPNAIKSAERKMAEDAAAKFGIPVETTAQDALMDLLAFVQGKVDFYRAQAAAVPHDQLMSGVQAVRRKRIRPGQPDEIIEEIQTASTVKNIWLVALDDAEKQLKDVAATITSLGIEIEKVKISKERAAYWHRVIIGVLSRFDISPEDPKLPGIVQAVMAELEPS